MLGGGWLNDQRGDGLINANAIIASFVLGLVQVQIEFKSRAREMATSVAFEGTLDGMVATVELVQYAANNWGNEGMMQMGEELTHP